MIKLKILNDLECRFVISGDEPFSIEVSPSLEPGRPLVHVYQGSAIDEDCDPIGAYDGAEKNKSWIYHEVVPSQMRSL